MSTASNVAIQYAMGLGGFQPITGTAAQTGPFCAITTISTTVFSSIVGEGISGSWTGVSIPAGITLVGLIESFQLSSGSVIAYNGKIT